MGVLNLGLLSGLMGGLGLNVGDVSVSGSATAATPAVATVAGHAAQPRAPRSPAAVPNVTTVHTGEYWSGTLPIILLAGLGLAGLLLIGRRRIVALARSLYPIRPPPGRPMSRPDRPTSSGRGGGPPPGPAFGTSSVPPPVSGAGPAAASCTTHAGARLGATGAAGVSRRSRHSRTDTAANGHSFRRVWREKQMQREPVLRTARNGTAESRSEQCSRHDSERGP